MTGTRRGLILILLIFSASLYGVQTKTTVYSVEHGLSQSSVRVILQDNFGQMWFGTRNGLNLFNGYEFERFLHDPSDSTSIINNEVTALFQLDSTRLLIGTRNGLCSFNMISRQFRSYDFERQGYTEFVVKSILRDQQGRLWVAAREGIFIFSEEIDNFISYEKIDASTGTVNAIVEDGKGQLWLGTSNGLFRMDEHEGWLLEKSLLYHQESIQENHITTLCFDRYNHLWAGTRNNGVYSINLDGDIRTKHFIVDSDPDSRLISNEIRSILEDEKGRIWIGTKEGLNIFDPFLGEVDVIVARTGIINSISQNSVYSLYEDKQGGIWVGTWSGGVNLLRADYGGFLPIEQFQDGEYSGKLDAVSSIAELDGVYWIGTENNGIILMDQDWNTIRTFNTRNTGLRLRSNHIKKIYKDHHNRIWIGYYDRGIQVYDTYSRTFTDQLDHINVYDIVEYPEDVFWISSGRSFLKLDLLSGSSESILYSGTQESTHSQTGATLLIDRNGVLWVGSRFGIDAYALSNERLLNHYGLTDFPSADIGLNIMSLAEDEQNRIWFGSTLGLYYTDPLVDTLIRAASDELTKYIIYSIIPYEGRLWLSTNDGIISYHPSTNSINRFTSIDGLQSNEFIRNSFFQREDHLMFFGGINGFNVHNPDVEFQNSYNPGTLISRFEFTEKKPDLPSEIFLPLKAHDHILKLSPQQPKISFDFVCIDYFNSEKISYSYKLDGFIDEWKDNGQHRSVSFTNLKPGVYTFRVQARDDSKQNIGNEAFLSFRISRAFYASKLAYLIYFIIISVSIYFIWKSASRNRTIQNELRIEKLEREKVDQLNEMKTKFFMNVSHEFRTPLTVIHGPIERMVDSGDYSVNSEEAGIMLKNSKRLIGLLDQLLELRRIEKNKSILKLEELDIAFFTKDVMQLFRTIAYEKEIAIEYSGPGSFVIWADREKMEKMISNLLSNAVKFTPEKGRILVEVVESHHSESDEGSVEISVIDNGIGMSQEEVEKIFDRFQSADKGVSNPKGIGIGLSLTKELVHMHHGQINVDTESGKGSAFTIILPLGKSVFEGEEGVEFIEEKNKEPLPHKTTETQDRGKIEKPVILVVDDNRDIRSYISGILTSYHLIEAESVEEAEILIEGNIPDLIISDVILPGKSGYEFCQQIKNEPYTSHIPIIIMTAKGNPDNRIHGLEIGADAFIQKPFSPRFLKVWVEKLIAARQKMFGYYMAQIMYGDTRKEDQKASMKDSFLDNARKIIENDIANPKLSVEVLSREMNMSRSNLHLKFKAIINQTPSDFIRIIRLNHSAYLLSNGDYNVVEAAYGSGFSSPSYFTKCFKQYFKKTPTEFMGQGGKL